MGAIKDFRRGISAYIKEARKIPDTATNSLKTTDLFRIFPAWLKSQKKGATPLRDHRPWMTFQAIEFLERFIQPTMTVFEYGSGGSTLFFAQRAAHVISVEHDGKWHQHVVDAVLQGDWKNCELNHINPAPVDPGIVTTIPGQYRSSDVNYQSLDFKEYARRIESYPDSSIDVIVIDGRARVSCFAHAWTKVKTRGCLILDNSEREEYAYIHQQMARNEWKRTRFFGPGPYNPYFWETTIWERPLA